MNTTTDVQGLVASGFEEVQAEFERNFAERGEIGAAVAAYWRTRGQCQEILMRHML